MLCEVLILDTAEEQVHETLMTYERLEEGGAEFGDERLEGIGSKYDDLRNVVRTFCEENDVDIEELQEPTMPSQTGRNHSISSPPAKKDTSRSHTWNTVADAPNGEPPSSIRIEYKAPQLGDRRSSLNSHGWKQMNFECLRPSLPPIPLATRSLRMILRS